VVAVEPDGRKLVEPIDGIDFVMGYDDCIRGTFDAVAVIDVLYKIPIGEWDALLARAAPIGRTAILNDLAGLPRVLVVEL